MFQGGGGAQDNQHFFIFDGHGSHVTRKVHEQATKLGLDMVTLLAHTLHMFKPLDVTYFKPFKKVFRKAKTMLWQKISILNQTKSH